MALLLSSSGRSRQQVIAAIEDVVACHNLSGAADDLGVASLERGAALERAQALDTDELPDGAKLRTQLISAMTHSQAADDAYQRWAEAVGANGCRSKAMKGADRKAGDAESKKATAAKKQVAELWNPVATRYDHPTVTYLQI